LAGWDDGGGWKWLESRAKMRNGWRKAKAKEDVFSEKNSKSTF
jgi:hypothetical protein